MPCRTGVRAAAEQLGWACTAGNAPDQLQMGSGQGGPAQWPLGLNPITGSSDTSLQSSTCPQLDPDLSSWLWLEP